MAVARRHFQKVNSIKHEVFKDMKIMKNYTLTIGIIAVLAACAFGQKAAAAKADPSKGVRDAFDRLIEGIKQVDADKVMSVYEKSERVLFFNNNGSATIGWENMKNNRESSYAKTKDV